MVPRPAVRRRPMPSRSFRWKPIFTVCVLGLPSVMCCYPCATWAAAGRSVIGELSLWEGWLRGQDLNLRPSGYEPDELPGCSTPRRPGRRGWWSRGGRVVGPRCGGDAGGKGRGKHRWRGATALRSRGMVAGPGGDLLSHVLRRSTMGAAGFHGRVRNGVGWGTRAMATRSRNHPARSATARGPRPPLHGSGDEDPCEGRRLGDAGKLMAWARLACGCRWGGSRSIERLGPVSCVRCRTCTPGLSTWWSTTALMARPGFEGGFPLRCFQRLSRPNLATRLCRWRDNRSTRGSSTPVLSY